MFFVHSFIIAIASLIVLQVQADITVTTTTTNTRTICPCDTTTFPTSGGWGPSGAASDHTSTWTDDNDELTVQPSTTSTASFSFHYGNSTSWTSTSTSTSSITTSEISSTSTSTITPTSSTSTTPGTTTTSSSTSTAPTSCPTTGTYKLQLSDGTYATLLENDSVPGAVNIQFSASSSSDATSFSFERTADSSCILMSPALSGTRSVVVDIAGTDAFVDFHYVYLLSAASGAGYTQSLVTCSVESDALSCGVKDQSTLQLYSNGLLSIAAGLQDGGVQSVIKVVEI